MLSSLDSANQRSKSGFLENISAYDGNVMLVAVVSLLLVILFVLLLHIYAKWFLAQARQRRSRSSISVSHVRHPSRFHHFHSFTLDTSSNHNNSAISSSSSKGIEASIIASIPLFVYSSNGYKQGLECVICLTAFEDGDVGRSLPKCGHGFHIECVDMWLHSHSNCPICRAPVVCERNGDCVNLVDNDVSNSMEAVGLELLEIVVQGGESSLERVSDVSTCENNQQDDTVSTSSSSSSLKCSLKRMLSRNRSDCKVFPSSTSIVNDFDG